MAPKRRPSAGGWSSSYETDWRSILRAAPSPRLRPATPTEVGGGAHSPALLRHGVCPSCRKAAIPAWWWAPPSTPAAPIGGAEPYARMNQVRAPDASNPTITVEAEPGTCPQACESAGSVAVCSLSLGGRGQLHHWRQPGHQRRRHPGAALRQCARACPGWGGDGRRRDLGRPGRAGARGQHGLRPARGPLHRQRGHVGIITAATIKLSTPRQQRSTALVACPSLTACLCAAAFARQRLHRWADRL